MEVDELILYIGICFLSVFIAWSIDKFQYKGKPINKIIQILLIALPSILVVGLRYGIGTDYFIYETSFNWGDLSRDVQSMKAPLYFNVYAPLIGDLGANFAGLVFITTCFIFILTTYQILEDSPYPWLSIFLIFGMLYFFAAMNIMRQMFAMSFLLCSMKYLIQKRSIPFLILLVVATGLHPACIMFVVVYLLYKSKIPNKVLALSTPFVLGAVYASSKYITVLTIFMNFDNYLGETASTGRITTITFIWQLLIIFLACIVEKQNRISSKEASKYRAYLITQLLTLWCYPLIFMIGILQFQRIIWLFAFPSIIYVPMLLRKINNKQIQIAVTSIIIICFFINMYMSIDIYRTHEVIPYQSIFDVKGII